MTGDEDWSRMHARVYDLELWRSRKDAVDEERHLQNTAAIKRVTDTSEDNGKKLDTLLLRTAGQEGQAKGRGQVMKMFWAALTLVGGSGLIEYFGRKH